MRVRLSIFLIILLVTIIVACSNEVVDFGNDSINDLVMDLDKTEKRLKVYEDDNILRVYDLEGDTYNVITQVMGYEEMLFINVILGVDAVKEVRVLYENETEGYGDYIRESWFLERFCIEGFDELQLVKYRKEKENEVVAVTGATISSQAVLEAVNYSLEVIGEE